MSSIIHVRSSISDDIRLQMWPAAEKNVQKSDPSTGLDALCTVPQAVTEPTASPKNRKKGA